MELIAAIQRKIERLAAAPPTNEWSDFYVKKFLELLLAFGLESQTDILADDRFGFRRFLSGSDAAFVRGEAQYRDLSQSILPDFLFRELDLVDWIREDDPNVFARLSFAPLSPLKKDEGNGNRVRKKFNRADPTPFSSDDVLEDSAEPEIEDDEF
jgi:hypothetical protein